jgi:subtilase family serine protease
VLVVMGKVHSAGSVCLLLAAAACSSSPESAPSGSLAQAATLRTLSSSTSGSGSPLLDLGSTDPTQVVSVSIVFKVTQPDLLEWFVQQTQEPTSPFYHQFLSVNDFVSFFAPSAHDIRRVADYVSSFGITVGDTLADRLVLKATGTVGQFTQAFTFTMHDFQQGSQRWHRPTSAPHLPSALSDVMLVVAGFSSQPAFVPKMTTAKAVVPTYAQSVVLPTSGTATGVPGSYTVGDFANQYDVKPLYAAGIDGTGSTIGIATLAGIDPTDAYTYWRTIGLNVRQDRIRQVHVDGGGTIGAQAGTGETALDIEQSGGIAYGANMVVYDAPNTDGGFLDVFYQAASDDVVDSLSVSWGGAEIFYEAALNGGTDFTIEQQAFHQVFLEGAAQGISIFAASGDSGAYDSGRIPGYSGPLTVDAPASDPAITAAGGTTTPYTISGKDLGDPSVTATFSVTGEQVWGWDGLQTYLNANSVGGMTTWNLFSTGAGGGVSVLWHAPWYQDDYPGMRRSEPGQSLTQTDPTTGKVTTLLTLPAHFEGRNVPDVSADADPFSGYLVYDTPDGGWQAGYGGTSFVAPQMNGVAALLRQRAGGRVGLWNPMLYRFARRARGGVKDVTAGDNWFYAGVRGYDPGSGVGSLDVDAFTRAASRSEWE